MKEPKSDFQNSEETILAIKFIILVKAKSGKIQKRIHRSENFKVPRFPTSNGHYFSILFLELSNTIAGFVFQTLIQLKKYLVDKADTGQTKLD